jgi:hypothetical protein
MKGGDSKLLNVAVCWSMKPRSLTDRLTPDNSFSPIMEAVAHLCQTTGRHILQDICIHFQNTCVFFYCFRLFHLELQSCGRNKLQNYTVVVMLLSGIQSNFTELCVCCWAVYSLTLQSCVSVVERHIKL